MSRPAPTGGYRPPTGSTIVKRITLIGLMFVGFAFIAQQIPTGGPIGIGEAFNQMGEAALLLGAPLFLIGLVGIILQSE